ncbi:MAG: zinc ribbon domain-containing protein [Candidatus Hodarchaeota archaeon]
MTQTQKTSTIMVILGMIFFLGLTFFLLLFTANPSISPIIFLIFGVMVLIGVILVLVAVTVGLKSQSYSPDQRDIRSPPPFSTSDSISSASSSMKIPPTISLCPKCGATYVSDAEFCPSCGVRVT